MLSTDLRDFLRDVVSHVLHGVKNAPRLGGRDGAVRVLLRGQGLLVERQSYLDLTGHVGHTARHLHTIPGELRVTGGLVEERQGWWVVIASQCS